MTANEIIEILNDVENNWETRDVETVSNHLKILKAEALGRNSQKDAKEIWKLETIFKIQNFFVVAFLECKNHCFYNAWCTLETVEAGILTIERHFPAPEADPFKIRFIQRHSKSFQSLFPYKLFMSPEFVKQKTYCSICNQRVSLRMHCGHEVGEIYNGELCGRILKEFQLAGMALVTNPVQKYSVAFSDKDDPEKYPLVQYVIAALSSPFHRWEVTEERQRHPHSHFKGIGRNEQCPCGSEKKYKKCCLPTEGVLRPHFQFSFSVLPPPELLKKKYI